MNMSHKLMRIGMPMGISFRRGFHSVFETNHLLQHRPHPMALNHNSSIIIPTVGNYFTLAMLPRGTISNLFNWRWKSITNSVVSMATLFSSTMKKRRMKMNKHKLKKRRKSLRMNTKASRN